MWPSVWLSPDWRCVVQPAASQVYLLQLMPEQLISLMLLIKVSATVTVYRGHHWTLCFLPGIISQFIICIGIIGNNSLVGWHARAEIWTPATVKLYCTWRPSALTTGINASQPTPNYSAWCVTEQLVHSKESRPNPWPLDDKMPSHHTTTQWNVVMYHLPVFVQCQHVEVGDVAGVRQLQSSLALGFVDEITNILTHKLTLITCIQPEQSDMLVRSSDVGVLT